jgi:hypothetical protein
VAGDVECAVLGGGPVGVDHRGEDPVLLVPRAGHHLSAGSDDDRVARVQPSGLAVEVVPLREVGRDVVGVQRAPGADDPAPALGRDVAQRRQLGVAAVPVDAT